MIKGKIIGLRAIEKEDLSYLKDWRNLEEFRRNFREYRELNMHNQDEWFNRVSTNPNDFMFTIVDLENNQVVGACGLLYINWIIRSADFSFYIGYKESYIDEKYAYDAAYTLIQYGFNELNLNKIWMELYEYDYMKLDFFKNKFDFKEDGILRDNAFNKGQYWNSHIISILKNEFN